jgi:hypothetical protein
MPYDVDSMTDQEVKDMMARTRYIIEGKEFHSPMASIGYQSGYLSGRPEGDLSKVADTLNELYVETPEAYERLKRSHPDLRPNESLEAFLLGIRAGILGKEYNKVNVDDDITTIN